MQSRNEFFKVIWFIRMICIELFISSWNMNWLKHLKMVLKHWQEESLVSFRKDIILLTNVLPTLLWQICQFIFTTKVFFDWTIYPSLSLTFHSSLGKVILSQNYSLLSFSCFFHADRSIHIERECLAVFTFACFL